MRTLRLLRHAKSSWDDPTLADLERPLAPRGRKATRRLARWIEENEVRPQLVLCSPARRARETLAGVVDALGSPPVIVEQGLYHASASQLLDRARRLPDDVDDALLVGHNPGLAELSLLLARAGGARESAAASFPTGALATLDAAVDRWTELTPGGAGLVALVLPRELA